MNVSIIIPSKGNQVKTSDSIPKGVETIIITHGNRSQARNEGSKKSNGEILVFCDDDICFSESFFWQMIQNKKKSQLIGLEDYDFGLLLTRFMIISKEDFIKIGGFDESLNHMEDTDFCMRAKKGGIDIIPIPVTSVYHIDHPTRVGKWERRRYYLVLFAKHRSRFVKLILHSFGRKLKKPLNVVI